MTAEAYCLNEQKPSIERKDTMHPLIEKDIVETEELLKQALKDMG